VIVHPALSIPVFLSFSPGDEVVDTASAFNPTIFAPLMTGHSLASPVHDPTVTMRYSDFGPDDFKYNSV
jgi:hypothetical protein